MDLTPTSSKFIRSLVDVKTTNPILQTLLLPAMTCAICTEDFGIDQNVNQLPCSHWFHHDCILPWLVKKNLCPLCRHELPKEEDMMMNHILDVYAPVGVRNSDELMDELFSILDGSEDDSQVERQFPDDTMMMNHILDVYAPVGVGNSDELMDELFSILDGAEDDSQEERQFPDDTLMDGFSYEDRVMEETPASEILAQYMDVFEQERQFDDYLFDLLAN